LKLAIAGKGGVGKTFVAASLARILARKGLETIAIDADPAMNLGRSLGVAQDKLATIVPLSDNSDLIAEKTGARPGEMGSVFNVTPNVSDVADRYGVEAPDGVRLLVMGTVKSGGIGCMCPANALLRALMRNVLIERKEFVVMDMEAGLEHLGRGTVRGVDLLLTVVEPGNQSLDTASKIRRLAQDLGIGRMAGIANKVRGLKEMGFIRERLANIPLTLCSVIPFDLRVTEADMLGLPAIDYAPASPALKEVEALSEWVLMSSDTPDEPRAGRLSA
jgi:CO dehydrogenase maturation factor